MKIAQQIYTYINIKNNFFHHLQNIGAFIHLHDKFKLYQYINAILQTYQSINQIYLQRKYYSRKSKNKINKIIQHIITDQLFIITNQLFVSC